MIVNMFADNGDDTWTVRFFIDGKARYVTVNRMLPVYGNGFGSAWAAGWGLDNLGFSKNFSDPTNELWVALAEKAYVQMNASGVIGQNGKNEYKGIDGGKVEHAFAHLGNVSGSNHRSFDQSDFIKSIKAGKCIVLATKDKTGSLIVPSHGYMVTGYNATTKMFSVYNPHGWNPNNGRQSPFVEMSWAAIKSNGDYWTDALI